MARRRLLAKSTATSVCSDTAVVLRVGDHNRGGSARAQRFHLQRLRVAWRSFGANLHRLLIGWRLWALVGARSAQARVHIGRWQLQSGGQLGTLLLHLGQFLVVAEEVHHPDHNESHHEAKGGQDTGSEFVVHFMVQ